MAMLLLSNTLFSLVLVFHLFPRVVAMVSQEDDVKPTKQQLLTMLKEKDRQLLQQELKLNVHRWDSSKKLSDEAQAVVSNREKITKLKQWLFAPTNTAFRGITRFQRVLKEQEECLKKFLRVGYGRKDIDFLPKKWTDAHQAKQEAREARFPHVLSSLEEIDELMKSIVATEAQDSETGADDDSGYDSETEVEPDDNDEE